MALKFNEDECYHPNMVMDAIANVDYSIKEAKSATCVYSSYRAHTAPPKVTDTGQ